MWFGRALNLVPNELSSPFRLSISIPQLIAAGEVGEFTPVIIVFNEPRSLGD